MGPMEKIEYDLKKINRVLKCKFLESHYKFHTMKSSSRVGWPYNSTRELLAQSGKDCQPIMKQSPSKMLIVDMDAIPKAWVYFMHHTLITEIALELYLLLTCYPVNIRMIISGDMDEISQSPKKPLGHATVILMLCQKIGVANLNGRQMVKPHRPSDHV